MLKKYYQKESPEIGKLTATVDETNKGLYIVEKMDSLFFAGIMPQEKIRIARLYIDHGGEISFDLVIDLEVCSAILELSKEILDDYNAEGIDLRNLIRYQSWRRGDVEKLDLSPKDISKAIDWAINKLQ